MKIISPGEKLPKNDIKRFAKTASEAYVNDPVHCYATKDKNKRKEFVYHFMMERLSTSNGQDYFFIDDENRGVCVWRKAHNEYTTLDFMKCPHWFFLYIHMPNTIRTLSAYAPLDVKKFDENCLIISPVFVTPEHQGKGIATKLIKESMQILKQKGFSFGLEAQDEGNVNFYKRLGFEVFDTDYFEKGKITHYYMRSNGENGNIDPQAK